MFCSVGVQSSPLLLVRLWVELSWAYRTQSWRHVIARIFSSEPTTVFIQVTMVDTIHCTVGWLRGKLRSPPILSLEKLWIQGNLLEFPFLFGCFNPIQSKQHLAHIRPFQVSWRSGSISCEKKIRSNEGLGQLIPHFPFNFCLSAVS